jgi:hypothetical protein
VLGRGTDVLAWNAMGHALFAGHVEPDSPAEPTRRPNMTRMVFLDPHIRELYVDWKAKARSTVAHIRMTAGRNPDDEENLTMPDDPEQLLVTVTAAPGSPSEAGLRLLGTLVGTGPRPGDYSRSASRTASA